MKKKALLSGILTSVLCLSMFSPLSASAFHMNNQKAFKTVKIEKIVKTAKAPKVHKEDNKHKDQKGKKTHKVQRIELSKSAISLVVGNTYTLTVKTAPKGADNGSITWASSNTVVATVSDGTVTALTAGNCVITAQNADGKAAVCVVKVTATAPVPTLRLSHKTVVLNVGKTCKVKAVATPSNAAATVTWTSSNTAIATVSDAGVITAVAAGSCTITATSADGQTATCAVTVRAVKPTVKSLSPVTLTVTAGTVPALPAAVTATMSDGTTKTLAVKWQVIKPAKYAQAGTFTVSGSVIGARQWAVATITVTAAS